MGNNANLIFNIAFYTIFSCVVIAYIYYCGLRLYRRYKLLQDVNAQMNKYTPRNACAQYPNIDKDFKNINVTKGPWSDYANSLIKTNTTGIYDIYSTTEATCYFNYTSLSEGIDISFWQNIGSVFTGLGILGTFAGLTIGLEQLDITSNDVTVLKEGIGALLQGMDTAFVTSLVGIIAAIVLNFTHNHLTTLLKREITALAETIENLYPRKTVEQLLAEGLIESQKQSDELRTFNTDVAIAIGNTINDQMMSHIGPLMTDLKDAIVNLGQGGAQAVSEQIQANAGTQLKDFSKTLEDSTEQMKKIVTDIDENLKVAVEKMVEASEKANSGLTATMSASSEQITKMVNALSEGAKNQSNSLAEAGSNMKDNLQGVVDKLTEAADKQNSAMAVAFTKLETMTNDVGNMMQKVNDAANTFSEAADPIREVTEGLSSQLDSVLLANREFNENVSTKTQMLVETAQKNASTIEEMQASLEVSKNAWQAYEKHFEGVSGEVGNTIDALTEKAEEYNRGLQKQLTDSLGEFDKHLSSAVSNLGTITDELGNSIDAFIASKKN
jgi:methyl-accepting chemotaxis protein